MKKKHEASIPRLFFTLPLRDNPDPAVALAYAQFIRERGIHHGLGGAMEYISRHAPTLRVALARTHSHSGGTAT
jgi:hypothetical protein